VHETTVVMFAALVVAVILHEISHGVVALWFGDDTAKRSGRLTLNPVPHVDPFGSLIVPALGAIAGLPVIGWAKPVPVDPKKLRGGRRDMLLVSLAGPTTNFLLAVVAAVVARFAFDHSGFVVPVSGFFSIGDLPLAVQVPLLFALVNLLLGVFNFLPVPPLDGAALLERFLPARSLDTWYRLRPYGFLLLFLLVFSTNVVNTVFDPFWRHLYQFVLR